MKLIQLSLLISVFAFSCSEAPSATDTKAGNETAGTDANPQGTDAVKTEKPAPKKVAQATLNARSGSKMTGIVVFTEENGNVTMEARMDNVNQGMHGFHIHESGDCSAADGTSAGGHWNPTNEAHGKWGVAPFHRGDIGNFEADANGSGSMSLSTDLWCLGCEDTSKDILGKSIIVHEGQDDCTSQPSGAAGARIACGAIEIKEKRN